jgi:hypothetical protein
MRTVLMALSVAAAVTAFGTTGFAAQAATTKAKPAAATRPAAATTATKAMSATGKIVGYDDGTRTLTLSTSKGNEKFMLDSGAKLQEGAKTIAAADLSGMAGHQAKVRYTASGSEKTAESVMVSGGAGAKSKK